jgi:LmbE family N-acetylglucosaminyl deacetylase
MKKRILTVAAHPDDEILGCAGTIAKCCTSGDEAFTLILGEGATSRDEVREREKRAEEIRTLRQCLERANAVLGVAEVFSLDFPDNRFDSVDLLDIVKAVENVVSDVRPDVLYTHFSNDLNIDHCITNRAVLIATRPMMGSPVHEVYAFEVLSSTEWHYPLTFAPDVYVDIGASIDQKIAAMREYATEIRDYPHPRSAEGLRLNARYWGMRVGVEYAEAFRTLRVVR